MDFLYGALHQIGFDHPIHPPLAHMPTGLVMGAFIFLLAGWISSRQTILQSAHHCIVLALIFALPTTLFGITDWLHFYNGMWSFPIKMKIALAGLLLIFLATAIIMNIKDIGGIMSKSAIYLLCVVTVIGLGYFGGGLVFSETRPASGNLADGEKLYAEHCAGCHPGGGNKITPALPIIGSPQMQNLDAFTKYNRNPLKPDGTKGVMPAFPKEKISDEDMKNIYEYILNVLAGKK